MKLPVRMLTANTANALLFPQAEKVKGKATGLVPAYDAVLGQF